MSDTPLDPDHDEEPGAGADGATTGMPRWVKISLIIAIVLVVALVVSRFLGVPHGPGLHSPPRSLGGDVSMIVTDQP
jgi:hypothetical protein